MAVQNPQPPIAALDIGSSKVSALIVARDDEGRLRVMGSGQRESRGVKRGYVTDMAAATYAIRDAVERAEKNAGTSISSVSPSGPSVHDTASSPYGVRSDDFAQAMPPPGRGATRTVR